MLSTMAVPSDDSVDHSTDMARNLILAQQLQASRLLSQQQPVADLPLSTSHLPPLMQQHSNIAAARNSCKTLKCPRCNWHYKYQETLEIHMREKHSEDTVTCAFCQQGQAHPKLARGETYSCGYKPYRCDVCKYSTTTKGNLSIHMQSDKHLNNMQEMQASGGTSFNAQTMIHAEPPPSRTGSSESGGAGSPLVLPTMGAHQPLLYRCDVCAYETPNSRNLRMHINSEKHSNNMLVAQGKMSFEAPPLVSAVDHAGRHAADADPLRVAFDNHSQAVRLYQCCVCFVYSTDSVSEMTAHCELDRTATSATLNDVLVSNGHYHCQLCNYRTHLKANFQLHTKTDKHAHKLQVLNHVREGGKANEWRARFITSSNAVHLRCNACNLLFTNWHKLRVHSGSAKHMCNESAFSLVRDFDVSTPRGEQLLCSMCNFSTHNRSNMIGHMQSALHNSLLDGLLHTMGERTAERMPQFLHVVARAAAVDASTDRPLDMSVVDESHACHYCRHTAHSRDDMLAHAHAMHADVLAKETAASLPPSPQVLGEMRCPLCLVYAVNDNQQLAYHLRHVRWPHQSIQFIPLQVHTLEPAGVDRVVVDPTSVCVHSDTVCLVCAEEFAVADTLFAHQTTAAHHRPLTATDGAQNVFVCRHTGCAIQFRTVEGISLHSQACHSGTDVEPTFLRCSQCTMVFKNAAKLAVHQTSHQTDKSSEGNVQDASLTGYFSAGRPFKCDVCREAFVHKVDLQGHFLGLAHSIQTKALLAAQATVNELSPTSSNNNRSDASNLNAGSQALDLGPFHCSVCSHTCQQAAAFEQHIRSVAHKMKVSRMELIEKETAQSLMLELVDRPSSTMSNEERQPAPNMTRAAGTVGRRLMEHYGLELAMQHGEEHSQRRRKRRHSVSEQDSIIAKSRRLSELKTDGSLSEYGKVGCDVCLKQFSSVWLLKAHVEHVHDFAVPPADVDRLSDAIKVAYDEATPTERVMPVVKTEPEAVATKPVTLQQPDAQPSAQQMAMEQLSQLAKNGMGSGFPAMLTGGGMNNTAFMSLMAAGMANNPMMMNPMMMSMMGAPNPLMLNMMMAAAATQTQANQSAAAQAANLAAMQTTANGQPSTRRARTRINDDQLRVLRQYFDINNSPTEAQIEEMSGKSGLPIKVIKHWFRNTLFKERQRNKDSPYNFSIPPSVSIDMESYERTGETRILNVKNEIGALRPNDDTASNGAMAPEVKIEPPAPTIEANAPVTPIARPTLVTPAAHTTPVKSEMPPMVQNMDPMTMQAMLKMRADMMRPPAAQSSAALSAMMMAAQNTMSSVPPMGMGIERPVSKSPHDMPSEGSTPAHNDQSITPTYTPSGGRRANRTRFSDHQLKSLQDFFEKQAYPKDDDLEYLSKRLQLSPRVIVVWFQNARQKARKVYENQPNSESNERFIKTPVATGCTYQCKRCQLVFPRYYELIQHQRKHCFKDADWCDEPADESNVDYANTIDERFEAEGEWVSKQCPLCTSEHPSRNALLDHMNVVHQTLAQPADLDALPNVTPKTPLVVDGTNGNAAIDMLRQFSNALQAPTSSAIDLTSPNALPESEEDYDAENFVDDFEDCDLHEGDDRQSSSPLNHDAAVQGVAHGLPPSRPTSKTASNSNKRFRTHLTPAQVHIMKTVFDDYKTPSMAECEALGTNIGLHKRVVQVWFQNARAKERKVRGVSAHHDTAVLSVSTKPQCDVCNVVFGSGIGHTSLQEHIFSATHLTAVREKLARDDPSVAEAPAKMSSHTIAPPVTSKKTSGTASTASIKRAPQPAHEANNGSSFGVDKNSAAVNSVALQQQMLAQLMSATQQTGSNAANFPQMPHMMLDAQLLGTPVQLLQIPGAVQQAIISSMQRTACDSYTFTQDGKSVDVLVGVDLPAASNNQVGWACRKCVTVFQSEAAHSNHQRMLCHSNVNAFALIQTHYSCNTCDEKFGTTAEFKTHCAGPEHKRRRV